MTKQTLGAALALVMSSQLAWGQVGRISPYTQPTINPRPTVSPFIRLRDGGGATTYYGQIRPQMQNTRNIFDLQQQFQTYEQTNQQYGYGLQAEQVQILPTTGHPVRFFDNSYFFSRIGAGGMSPVRTGPIGAANPAPYNPTGTTGMIRGY